MAKAKHKGGGLSADPEARARQLANLSNGGRRKGTAAYKRAMEAMPPKLDDARYRNEHGAAGFVAFTEDQFFLPDPVLGRRTVLWEPWQREGFIAPLFDPPLDERATMALVMMCKKNGKSAFGAGVAFYRLCRADYEPEAPPEELYFLAADKEQSSWIMFDKLRKACMLNPRVADVVDIRKDSIERKDGKGVLRYLPCDASVAGLNPSGVFVDELWLYRYERMREVWEELTVVPTRRDPQVLVVSYAGNAEECLLRDLYGRGLRKFGLTAAEGAAADVLAAKPGVADTDKRFFFYCSHVNQASWVTAGYLAGQRENLRVNTYRRLHENRWTSGEEAFCTEAEVDACVEAGLRRGEPMGQDVYVGVDVGTKNDCAAVVAVAPCDIGGEAGARLVEHMLIAPDGVDHLDLGIILDVVKFFADAHDVQEVRYDPYQMVRVAQEWDKLGLTCMEWPQTVPNLVRMHNTLHEHITQGRLVLYADADVKAHILNANVKEHPQGWRLVKRTARRKIDFAIALAMAVQGCAEGGALGTPSVTGESADDGGRWLSFKHYQNAWLMDNEPR